MGASQRLRPLHITTETGHLTTFRELGVLPEIADALERVGITTPFPIQEMTLSVALLGTDLIGQARTGTGKTLAFGIPVLQRSVAPHDPDYAELAAPGKPQALIVAPTRELALQVASDLTLASKDRGIRVLTVYGGVPLRPPARRAQARRRRRRRHPRPAHRPDEPPRARPLPRQGAGPRRGRRDARPGFLPDVERLIAQTPETRQTMLFSATMPAAIVVAGPHPHAAPDEHPRRVRRRHRRWSRRPRSSSTRPTTSTSPRSSRRILQAEDAGLTIVFTRTKRQAQRVAEDLIERGFPPARCTATWRRSPARRR